MSLSSTFLIVLLALLCSKANSNPIYISMITLITFPERYVGKEVILIGFNSRRTLFLTEEAAKYGDISNAIFFSDKREGFYDYCEEAHVRIVGRVLEQAPGGIFLQDVSSIYSLDGFIQCEASLKNEYNPRSGRGRSQK